MNMQIRGRAALAGCLCLCLAAVIGCGSPSGELRIDLDPNLAVGSDITGLTLLLVEQDPNIIWSEIKLDRVFPAQDELTDMFLAAVDSLAVARGRMDERGRAALDCPPGDVRWVITAELLPAGAVSLLWSVPVTGPGARLRLQRSNAALVFASAGGAE